MDSQPPPLFMKGETPPESVARLLSEVDEKDTHALVCLLLNYHAQLTYRLNNHIQEAREIIKFVTEMQAGARWSRRLLIGIGAVLAAAGTVVGILKEFRH